MITVIRIKGLVGIPEDVEETLSRNRLRRKYSCVLMKKNKETEAILKKIRNHVAYGESSDEIIKKLIETRGKVIKGKKLDVNKVFDELKKNGKSEIIKPFFRLHSPRKGIKSKLHYPKGALGDHGKDIDKLLIRML